MENWARPVGKDRWKMSSEHTVNDTAAVSEQSDGQQPGARPSRSERDREIAEELVAQAAWTWSARMAC